MQSPSPLTLPRFLTSVAAVILALLATVIPPVAPSAAQSGTDEGADEIAVDLEGTWKFITGDDEAWSQPDFDDSAWEDVTVPTEGGQPIFNSYDGFAWFRLEFDLPAEAEGANLVASLGFIDDADISYLNGVEIGRTGVMPPDSDSQWFERRLYPVPASAPNFGGRNVLAVRMNDFTGGGGWYRGPVGIFSKAALREAVFGITGPLAPQDAQTAAVALLEAQAAALAQGDAAGYLETLDAGYQHDGRNLDRRQREIAGWIAESGGQLTLTDGEVEVIASTDGRMIIDTNRSITGTRDGEPFAFQPPVQEFLVFDPASGLELGNRSRFFRDFVESENEGKRREYVVYLPPSYFSSADHQFPTVYLFHGINGGSREWEPRDFQQRLDTLFTDGGLAESIVIMPDGESLWYIDSSVTPWRSMFVDEMLPQVDAEFRTLPQREFRGTNGVSMGGHGAFTIAWANPDLFSAIASHMGALDFPPLVGGPDEIALNTPETPVIQAGELSPDFLDDFRYYFDACEQDDFRFDDAVRAMTNELTGKMVEHTAVVFPEGVHNDDCWVPHLDASFGLHSENFRANGLVEPFPVRRLEGPSRIATSVAVSRGVVASAGTAVVATAGGFPDAIASGPLAASLKAPLLLTETDALDPAVADELARLGVSTVYVIGGTVAISDAVVAELEAMDLQVTRLDGPTRFETAAAVAAEMTRLNPGTDVLLGTGLGFADSLSAINLASAINAPLVLTPSSVLNDTARTAVTDLIGDGGTVYVLGGDQAVSPAIVTELESLGLTVIRLGGATRYDTADAILAQALRAGADLDPTLLATGADYPDALSAGVAAAILGGSLLLIDGTDLDGSAATAARLDGSAASELIVVGGTNAVTAEVLRQAVARVRAG